MISLRFIPIWRRNALVWRKLAVPSILGNLADPMIYMLGLGYGLGALLPEVGGVSYIVYISGGMLCFSTANSATFEALYSSFSRMHVQKTWDAIMAAPITLRDIVAAELVWAASKSVLSGLAILLVVWGLGLSTSWLSLWTLCVIPLIGLCFGALALVITSLAPNYDFFMYYFTLVITPMTMLCGVFFPTDRLPPAFRIAADALPMSHATSLVRPLLLGTVPDHIFVHLAVLAAYAAGGTYVSFVLLRRRLAS